MSFKKDGEYICQDAKQSRHVLQAIGAPLDLIICSQWAHTTFVAGYLYIFRYIRRHDEDLQRYNRNFLADNAMEVG